LKPLLALIFVISLSANAEGDYIEFGVTDVGSWDTLNNWIEDANTRSRKFVSFHKELDDNFYLLGSYTRTKTKVNELVRINCSNNVSLPIPLGPLPPLLLCDKQYNSHNLKEEVSTLGVGYEHSLKSFDLYAELSAYRYTQSSNNVRYQLSRGDISSLLSRSEIISIFSGLTRHGSMYRLGLRKELIADVDIDISYGSYNNTKRSIGGRHRNRNKSIKLIKDFDDKFSLVFNYEKDGDGELFKRTNRSLSLRTKF